MAKRIGAAILAATLMFGGFGRNQFRCSGALTDRRAKSKRAKPPTSAQAAASGIITATIYRPRYQAYYYDRPVYYAPAPFFPFLGLGYGPWW